MDDVLPERPRLADHALPRRHVTDGVAGVVVFDQRTGGIVQVDDATWEVLAAADGTRNLEGIRLAARRAGTPTSIAAIAELLGRLHALGLLAGPTRRHGPPRVVIERDTPADRPIEPLPGFAVQCDRSGACCRQYATVLMTTAEVERARALLPDHRVGPVAGGRVFLPVAGSEPGELWAPAHRDGACGYLEDAGTCAIHRAGGLAAKPTGCALFPVTFVDDGQTVRASVKTECACVLDSAGMEPQQPLVDPAWRRAGDLPPLVAVQVLHEKLALTRDLTLPTPEARALVDAWFAGEAPSDPAASAWAMAQALQERGPDAALRAWREPTAPDAEAIVGWIRALGRRASARARDNAAWRSEADAVRSGVEWIAAAARLLSDVDALAELVAAPAEAAATETFYLWAAAFGWALFDRPLQESLHDRAARIWLARAMACWPDAKTDAARRQPLATVDALLRGYGIGNYVDDLAATRRTRASPASPRDE